MLLYSCCKRGGTFRFSWGKWDRKSYHHQYSQFSEGVQTFCNLFPASCVTILFRRALLSGLLDHMNSDVGGVDQGLFVESLKEIFTFQANVFEQKVSVDWTVFYCWRVCRWAKILLFTLPLF